MSSSRKSKLTIIDDPTGWTEHAPGAVKRPESVTPGWPRYLAWIGPGLYVGHAGLAEALIEAQRHGGLVYEPLALTTAERLAAEDDLARVTAERNIAQDLVLDRNILLASLRAERDALQRFKDWVHDYLDVHGVPHHPPGTHGAAGCRIGDRMDWLTAELAKARADAETLRAALRHVETWLSTTGCHTADCPQRFSRGSCTCGFTGALASIRAALVRKEAPDA